MHAHVRCDPRAHKSHTYILAYFSFSLPRIFIDVSLCLVFLLQFGGLAFLVCVGVGVVIIRDKKLGALTSPQMAVAGHYHPSLKRHASIADSYIQMGGEAPTTSNLHVATHYIPTSASGADGDLNVRRRSIGRSPKDTDRTSVFSVASATNPHYLQKMAGTVRSSHYMPSNNEEWPVDDWFHAGTTPQDAMSAQYIDTHPNPQSLKGTVRSSSMLGSQAGGPNNYLDQLPNNFYHPSGDATIDEDEGWGNLLDGLNTGRTSKKSRPGKPKKAAPSPPGFKPKAGSSKYYPEGGANTADAFSEIHNEISNWDSKGNPMAEAARGQGSTHYFRADQGISAIANQLGGWGR